MAHRQVSSPASVVVDGETAQGPVVGWKVGLGSVVPQRLSPPTVSLDPGRWSSGASPADSSSAFASSCSSVQVLVAALFKALWRWGYSSSMGGGWLPASAGGDGIWRMRPAEVPRTF